MIRRKILEIQETDWILRGPHQQHHILERLNPNAYEVRIVDFPLIWDPMARRTLPRFQPTSRQSVRGKGVPARELEIYRPPFVNLPIFNIVSLVLQRFIIKSEIETFRPDIVLCFGALANINYTMKLCRRRNIPVLYYLMEDYHTLVPTALQPISFFVEAAEHKAIRNSNLNLVITEELKNFVDKVEGTRTKSRVIPGGVDLKRYEWKQEDRERIRQRFELEEDDLVLFFMGWLYEFSGLKEVALELARSPEEYQNIKLLIVGKGELSERLSQIKNANEMKSRIAMVDWAPYEEIPQYLAAADVCILPAVDVEVMKNIVPIKVYEYMAAAKPVIATNLPGIRTEFGLSKGIHFVDRPQDVPAKAMEMVDHRILVAEGKKARMSVEDNDWEVIVGQFEGVLKDVARNT